MAKMKRILFVIVPCLLLLFSTVTAANAAFLGGGSLDAYWNQYNLPGYTSGGAVTQPTALPPAPAQPTAPSSIDPLQSYWSKYKIPWGTTGGGYTTPTVPPTAPPPVQPPAPPPTDTSGLSADESLMFSLVNQERVKAGLPAFTIDMRLVNLARMKSQDMYQNNYFSHTSPTYGSAYDMERKAGISARVMGAENIARAATTQRAHELFMGSPGHKANIMNSLHDSIGIGIVKTPNGVYVTQLFLGD